MKRIVSVVAVLACAAALVFAGAKTESASSSGELSGTLAMGGSTTVEPIAQSAIEAFVAKHPRVSLSYDSQGSSVGVQGVIDGVYVLGGSSRDLKQAEIDKGATPVAISLDGIAVIVNGGVPVDNLTKKQVSQIFTGKVKNWKDLGGPDAAIVVVNRDEASGTRAAFLELVLQPEAGKEAKFIAEAITVESNGDMVTKVGQTPNAVGYCGFGYIERARNQGGKDIAVNGVKPEMKYVYDKSYPVSRSLYLCHKGPLADGSLAKAFVDFVLSAEGQAIVKDKGFIPLP